MISKKLEKKAIIQRGGGNKNASGLYILVSLPVEAKGSSDLKRDVISQKLFEPWMLKHLERSGDREAFRQMTWLAGLLGTERGVNENCLPLLHRIIRKAGNTPQCREMQPSVLVITLKNKTQTFKVLLE